MAKLEVSFEMVAPAAFAQGQEAGKKYADGFYAAFAGNSGVAPKTGGGGSSPASAPSVFEDSAKRMSRTLDDVSAKMKGYGMADLPKLFSKQGFALPDVEFPDLKKAETFFEGLREITGKDLAKALDLPDIASFGPKIKGLREIGGADLAKVQALPDITSYDKPKSAMVPEVESFFSKFFSGIGTGIIPELAAFTLGLKAVELSFDGLKSVVEKTIDAFEDARRNYANATTSGFGLKAGIQRTNMAEIIGVGENEVFQYASAFRYLNDRLKFSSAILAENSTRLTETDYNWKILGKDMDAMFSKVGRDFAPAVDKFISFFDKLVKKITESIPQMTPAEEGLHKWKTGGSLSEEGQRSVDIERLGKKLGLENGKRGEKDVADALAKIGNLGDLEKSVKSAKNTGPFDKINNRDIANFTDMWNAVHKSDLQSPNAYMKQLPVSQWERMGLVIGGGAGTNYAQHTATNTRKTYEAINNLAKALALGAKQTLSTVKSIPSRP